MPSGAGHGRLWRGRAWGWSAWRETAAALSASLGRSRDRTARLVQELRWLLGTLDSMPDGWIVLQRGGAIEAVNEGASTLLGLARRDRRRNFQDLLRDRSIASLVRGEVEDGIVEVASPVDESRRLELRYLPVDENRSIILIRDVTMLDRLLTMRQDFIANVSHELRTPLTVIIGYLEALEDDDIDQDMLHTLLGRLRPPANRMKALVEDLLTLTRLESSPIPGPADMEDVNAAAMLESAVNEARQLATPEHEIVLEADSSIVARAVAAELHSAFFNLIANAIRYSPDGAAWWQCAGTKANRGRALRWKIAVSAFPKSTYHASPSGSFASMWRRAECAAVRALALPSSSTSCVGMARGCRWRASSALAASFSSSCLPAMCSRHRCTIGGIWPNSPMAAEPPR